MSQFHGFAHMQFGNKTSLVFFSAFKFVFDLFVF